MLFKISLKNISKSIKDYAIYFFTLVLGVAIFYVFNAIDSQTAMMNLNNNKVEIITLMNTILSEISVFVSVILACLIIYASRFLMKRRNKEFAIYLTLGMSKRKISFILFLETLIIGIVSLTVGILAGFLLSQLMSILVANMFEANLTKFQFVFSENAFLKTLMYFGIMYIIVMIFNTVNISKCKLIDLLNSNKKSEKVKLKNTWICLIIFIIACCTLGYAYSLVADGIDKFTNESQLLISITLGAVSTFFIFWSLSGLMLKIVRKNKRFYYKKLNGFTIRQISSKVNTTVLSMTIICLMLFITICVLSSSLSMKNSLNRSILEYAPRDAEISISKNVDTDENVIDNSDLDIKELFNEHNFDYKKYLKNVVEFSIYKNKDITLESSLGDYYKTAKEKLPYLRYKAMINLMKNSEYNKLADSFNMKKVDLNDDEYVVVGNYKNSLNIKNEALKLNTEITLNSKKYHPKYKEAVQGFYQMTSNETEEGFIVLPDSALTENDKASNFLVADYEGNKEEIEKMINNLINTDDDNQDNAVIIGANTKLDIKDASVGLGAIVTFIGLYLGMIFLISCVTILALKELSESSDNYNRFQILRRIGVEEKDLNKALFRQIGIFFMFPLVLAIIHSAFGIMFCNSILKSMGVAFDLKSVIITSIFIIIIYGGYFLVTYLCSKNIIKENRY